MGAIFNVEIVCNFEDIQMYILCGSESTPLKFYSLGYEHSNIGNRHYIHAGREGTLGVYNISPQSLTTFSYSLS